MFRTYASSAPSLLSFGWVRPVQVSAVFWWVFNLKLYFLIWVDLEREKRVSREHFWFTFFEWHRVELLTVFDFHSEWERGRNIFFNQVISEIFVSKISVTIRRDVSTFVLVSDLFFPLFYALFCFNFCQRKNEKWLLCLIERGKKYEWLIKFLCYEF